MSSSLTRDMEDARPGRIPRLREEAETVAASLPPLLVEAERVASTVAQGVHGRRRVGQGETFWQFRRFQVGDSVNKIDWRRSARSQHMFVRETEWEAAQSVWLWRDASPSMNYGREIQKVHRAGVLALALGILLVQAGERIAALGEPFPPQTGRLPLRRLAYLYMQQSRGDAPSLPAPSPLPRYSHTVWFSDFLSDADAITERMRALAGAGVKGHLLQILDPAEADYPFIGRVRFESVEDDAKLLVGRAELLKADYTHRLAAHQERLGAEARRLGWTFSV
ncbi:MAG: DUF58 domain-containing protein, partial [Alphaproteobacteria bacterium]